MRSAAPPPSLCPATAPASSRQRSLRQGLWSAGILLAVALAPGARAENPAPLPAESSGTPAPADTVRTNLWLVQALMAEVVRATLPALPPSPASIALNPLGKDAAHELFGTVATDVLAARGYELYLNEMPSETLSGEADSASTGPAEYDFRFKVEQVQLGYPAVGRTLGFWRQWVAREFVIVTHITVVKNPTGRLLLNERVVRSFNDRVPSASFEDVRSTAYPFTDAETKGSGWGRRLEEIVVLGTLTGLVIIYFANTGS